MNGHDPDGVDQDLARVVAARMATAADAWLDALDDGQRSSAHWGIPTIDPDTETERRRWYYTPTDHGGLQVGRQQPAQQSLAMQLVASGLSTAGYVTVSTVLGLENVLDRLEDFAVDWGRGRGRDPGAYYLRIFGVPGPTGAWGWRFGGHHVSLNNLVVDGRARSTTPCFIGADPATSELLGGERLRPLGAVEDLARELVRSLRGDLAASAILLDRPPSDLVGGNRSQLAPGDQMLQLPEIWRGRFTEPRLIQRVHAMADRAEADSGYGPAEHRRMALSADPPGVSGAELGVGQREVLAALLDTYRGRVPPGLPAPVDLDDIHFAWAGSTAAGAPHYYRLQGPRLLVEWDNTARGGNHAHSVWRDPVGDFGSDVLGAHRNVAHTG